MGQRARRALLPERAPPQGLLQRLFHPCRRSLTPQVSLLLPSAMPALLTAQLPQAQQLQRRLQLRPRPRPRPHPLALLWAPPPRPTQEQQQEPQREQPQQLLLVPLCLLFRILQAPPPRPTPVLPPLQKGQKSPPGLRQKQPRHCRRHLRQCPSRRPLGQIRHQDQGRLCFRCQDLEKQDPRPIQERLQCPPHCRHPSPDLGCQARHWPQSWHPPARQARP